MELKDFIQNVLLQMEELKSTQNKSNYLVEELEFELSLTQTEAGNVGVRILVFGADGRTENQNIQKVKVKLIPKNSRRKISMSI